MYLEQEVAELKEQVMYLTEKLAYIEKTSNDVYLSPKQLAAKMNCTSTHITNLVKRGELEGIKAGKLVRIPVSQFYRPQKERQIVAEQKPKKMQDWKEELRQMMG